MRIVVTGGLGFIGSHVVERFVMRGVHTVVLDDSSTGRLKNLAFSRKYPELEVVEGDIRNPEVLRRTLEGTDTVIHLAAIVSVPKSVENPTLVAEVNDSGTLNVLGVCVEKKVQRLVFASSAAVYGGSRPPLREGLLPVALSPYAASKVAGEAYCRAFSESYGLETVVLRFFNVYGPRSIGQYAGVMFKFADAIKRGSPLVISGDGRQTRDFVHVNDVVNAIVLASSNARANREIFNIGSGKTTTINELAKLFLRASGADGAVISHVAPRASEIRFSGADITKARSMLGFEPSVELRSGVVDYLSWALAR